MPFLYELRSDLGFWAFWRDHVSLGKEEDQELSPPVCYLWLA
jgi:hypothetical protein